MSKFFGLVLLVGLLGCSSQPRYEVADLSASRDEAVVNGVIVETISNLEGGQDCGKEPCYAKIKVDSVVMIGQNFGVDINMDSPILAYFPFGMQGNVKSEDRKTDFILPKTGKRKKIQALVWQDGTIGGKKSYTVNRYRGVK